MMSDDWRMTRFTIEFSVRKGSETCLINKGQMMEGMTRETLERKSVMKDWQNRKEKRKTRCLYSAWNAVDLHDKHEGLRSMRHGEYCKHGLNLQDNHNMHETLRPEMQWESWGRNSSGLKTDCIPYSSPSWWSWSSDGWLCWVDQNFLTLEQLFVSFPAGGSGITHKTNKGIKRMNLKEGYFLAGGRSEEEEEEDTKSVDTTLTFLL